MWIKIKLFSSQYRFLKPKKTEISHFKKGKTLITSKMALFLKIKQSDFLQNFLHHLYNTYT